jgi:hypothetical protein
MKLLSRTSNSLTFYQVSNAIMMFPVHFCMLAATGLATCTAALEVAVWQDGKDHHGGSKGRKKSQSAW